MGRLLITGAAGRVGTVLRRGLRDRWSRVRLLDLETLRAETDHEEVVVADLRDEGAVADAVADVDAVIHLGALSGEQPFHEHLETTFRGTYHVLEHARRHGVPRVVYASTNHVLGYHRVPGPLQHDAPPRPDTYYGVAKVGAEGLASLYADKFGLTVVAVRIGTFRGAPIARRHLATWLSHRDAVHLFERCTEAPVSGYHLVPGVSANTRSWWPEPAARVLGYRPRDDAEAFADEIEANDPLTDPDDPAEVFVGGAPFVGWDEHAYGPRR